MQEQHITFVASTDYSAWLLLEQCHIQGDPAHKVNGTSTVQSCGVPQSTHLVLQVLFQLLAAVSQLVRVEHHYCQATLQALQQVGQEVLLPDQGAGHLIMCALTSRALTADL